MSKVNEIQRAIRQLEGGAYQKLMDEYVYKRFGYKNFVAYGSHTGTNKTTKGVPDSYTRLDNGKYIYLMYGTPTAEAYKKVKSDILACLDEIKKDEGLITVDKIICCHTSSNFSPEQNGKLRDLFANTEVIGIDELSLDLHQRYPQLAKDHLGISVDTNQILNVDDFIAVNQNEQFSTPLTTRIIGRDKEIKEVIQGLESNNVVIVTGIPGSGKTRLALEVARQYSDAHACQVKVIRSNGAPLYDDIPSHFSDGQQYLIIVDDANQLSAIDYMFDFALRAINMSKIRLLLTVRDYAKDAVLQKANRFASPAVYQLKRCNNETISTILKGQFGINNEVFLEQINSVAKGNIRVAIMAAIKARNGSFLDIQDVSKIYQVYFEEALSGLTDRELSIASYIAYFDAIELSAKNDETTYLAQKGIMSSELTDVSLALHKREIVDMYERQAVCFSQQNLQDYLLYHSICVSKELPIADIIFDTFSVSPKRAIYVFNTILGIFYSTKTHNFMSKQAIEVWNRMDAKPFGEQLSFIKAFASLLKNEALTFVNKQIDCMPEEYGDFLNYKFSSNAFGYGNRRTLLDILASFKHSIEFSDAISLFIKLLKKNFKYPDDFHHILTNELSVDPDSHYYDYNAEMLLLKRLENEYTTYPADNIASCLLIYCKSLLSFVFSGAKSNEDYSVTFSDFGYLKCESAYSLRAQCIRVILTLYQNTRYGKKAGKVLFDYPFFNKTNNIELAERDIRCVAEIISSISLAKDINDCILLEHFSSLASKSGLPASLFSHFFDQDSSFTLLKAFLEDMSQENDFEKEQEARSKRIWELWGKMSKEEREAFFFSLSQDYLHEINSLKICMGLTDVLTARMSEEELCSCVEMYFEYNTPFSVDISKVESNLVATIGFERARTIVEKYEFDEKQRWITSLFNFITVEEFGESEHAEMLHPDSLLCNGGYCFMSAKVVYKLNAKYPSFFVDYLTMLSTQEKKEGLLHAFIDEFLFADKDAAMLMCELYSENLSKLEELYCLAYLSYGFDHNGNLLLAIVERDISFAHFLFSNVSDKDVHSHHVRAIMRLWESEKYSEIVNIVVASALKAERKLFIPEAILFSISENSKIQAIRQDNWIKQYIKDNASDLDKSTFIFNFLLYKLPQERRFELLLCACQHGCPFSAFQQIYLFPIVTTWSGSQIPILIEKKRQILELRDKLCEVDLSFEHRAFLDSQANALQQRINDVELQEFLDNHTRL